MADDLFPSGDTRDRVAVVVQRWHRDVAGGAENLARHYADLLRDAFRVDLITTTALDTETWNNDLESGATLDDGVRVLRFAVSSGRTDYFHKLHNLLMARYRAYRAEPVDARLSHAKYFDSDPAKRMVNEPGEPIFNWTTAMQEEWIRSQGPHSADLLRYLEQHQGEYRAILFLTYLYSPTYFGTFLTDKERTFLVPTFHDEPPAYLPVYRAMAQRARFILWLTPGEKAAGTRFWGDLPGRIASFGINTTLDDSSEFMETDRENIAELLNADAPPFLLYCGRIDTGKGCGDLISNFRRFRVSYGGELKLVLTGSPAMELPRDPNIIYGGFVTEAEKLRLMNRCAVFVMPSPHESLSIVTLEAMARRKPVLVNGEAEVLRGHVGDGRRGRAYTDAAGFASELRQILEDADLRLRLGAQARTYVLENFDLDTVRGRLIEEMEKTPAS